MSLDEPISSLGVMPMSLDAPRSPSGLSHRFQGRTLTVTRGSPLPLGARPTPDGINFVLLSRHATSVHLLLYEIESEEIAAEIPLDHRMYRTGDHWHVRILGLPDAFCYGFRVDGPDEVGNRFDPRIVLLDPTARALSHGRPWGGADYRTRRSLMSPSLAASMIDQQISLNPRIPREDTILYELHVRGFTIDPSSGVGHPGTFAGLAEKIPYLKDLGVTAVELLPVDEFDENDCPFVNPRTGERLHNFWGYSNISYGVPKAAYASDPTGTAPWDEFRRTIDAFHAEGIEVVLDVVFNHTAEQGEDGPTYSFRGLDNRLYYLLDDHGRYLNFTGCGNTLNTNHPIVRGMLLSCLRNLVAEAGVDGFRFDLASVLGRDRKGHVMVEPPVLEQISEDAALLADTKMIAEPWDAAGLYQVSNFPGGGAGRSGTAATATTSAASGRVSPA